jgi:hypothetical protein
LTAIPPLLKIMDGKKARPRKAPLTVPKEYRLQTDVADILKAHALPEWRWSHFPAGERRDVRTGTRLKRMGLQRGWPDFQLISPRGLFHALELKRAGEDLTEEQEAFQLWSIRHGVPHSVAFTIDEALAVLGAWGVLRVRIGGAR